MKKMRKHLLFAALVGLGLRLFFVWHFRAEADDTALYEELARNWLDYRTYGLFSGGHLMPVDLRMPGYPAFLAAIYAVFGRARLAVMLVQAVLDLATCFLTAGLAAQLVPPPERRRAAIAALWLAATCPFVANYAAVPLTEVLATFLTAAALLALLRASTGAPPILWFFAALLGGLGTLVRPETPLLLAAAALVLVIRWRRRADWPKLVRAGALLTAGFVLPLLPWAARNWRSLHEVQPLAPRYSESPGEFVPRGFYAWTQTWLVRFRDVYLASWKLGDQPIQIEDLPPGAFDTPEERARVAALLAQYNAKLAMWPELDREFGELARERARRHPLRTHLWIPLERAATLWFTPRIELLPYSGHLWPLAQQWKEDPVDFSVTVLFALLNYFYVVLALAGAWRAARRRENQDLAIRWALALVVAFLVVRTASLTHVETPEPRYVLECFPALLALAALVWAWQRIPAAQS
jgi:4-amino-4-deoxy-L-arabinose transferase-like glycosyltransferase